jgi:prevent-host-death family protein
MADQNKGRAQMIVTSTYEAKARLSELLSRVLNGEEVWITRHRIPIARIVPMTSPQQDEKEKESQS